MRSSLARAARPVGALARWLPFVVALTAIGDPAWARAEGGAELHSEVDARAPEPEPEPSRAGSGLAADVDIDATGIGIKGQLDSLGSFERRALDAALARRHLTLDLSPYGKTIGKIVVVNLNVFGKDAGFLRLFNFFHVTTREHVIEREVLLRPGDTWDDRVVQETRRRLTDISVTTLAVLAPVRSSDDGKVDLLVVTRDIWSLRLNSNYSIAGNSTIPLPGFGGTIISASLSPSENNLLGLRKQLAAIFALDLGQWSVGPYYNDPRVLGTRWHFASRFQTIFARDDSSYEGTASATSISYPLWSYRREWGGSLSVSHRDAPVRQFEGTAILTYDDPDTAEVEAAPRIYDSFGFATSASVTRSFGYDYKSNVSVGHQLLIDRPALQDDFQGDDALRQAFIDDVLPRSERSSSLFVSYSFFTPRFVTYRNINTFSLAEDVQLGPSMGASLSLARKELGSERNFVNLSLSAGWTQDIAGDGYARITASASNRVEGGDAKDNVYVLSGRLVPPRLFGLVRMVARFAYRNVTDNENNEIIFLGGQTGLRGYDIATYRGDTRFIANVELRSPPLRLWFMQWGAVAFWDVGHATTTGADDPFTAAYELSLKHDVGTGVRLLVPQLQPFVFSFDLAYALNEPPRPSVPGAPAPPRLRLLLYIDQAF